MMPPYEFFQHYAAPRRPATEMRAQRMRAAALARLRGFRAREIAQSLDLSTHTVRGMLNELGLTVADGWQRHGFYAFEYRLKAIGINDAELSRTGARTDGEMWYAADMPTEPPQRWLERRALAHRRYLRRQRRAWHRTVTQ